MTKLRPITQDDILRLDELWQKYWSHTCLPNRRNAVVDSLAVDEKDRIIGYGQVKRFAESMLFLDPTTPKRDRVSALKQLMAEAMRGARSQGYEDIYAFIKDPYFADLISSRYGFERVTHPGELLLKIL